MDTSHISWHAPEHEHHEHSPDWYWVMSIMTVALAIVFFILNNILLSIILLLGVGTLLYHALERPRVLKYELSRKGVRAGNRLYPWESLQSFWIMEGDEKPRYPISAKILIISKKQFMPHIVVPLGDEVNHEDVHEILSTYIDEEYQLEPIYDRIMRKVGF